MEKTKVYFNHDGGVDDLASLFLLLNMDEVELVGVSVIPADCYLEPAVSASRKIIDRFGKGIDLNVSASNSRGINPFPKEWRMHAFYVDALPILNESNQVNTPMSERPAHLHLIDVLESSSDRITLLFTGPLTDLARALEEAPAIEQKIEKLVWMGGTFLEAGNVEEPEHDGTAEWNAFWDPEAVATVFNTSITIEMVALESTNQVPLTNDIRNMWAAQRKEIGVDFIGQCYAMCPPLVHVETNSTYYLWDVLTTVSVTPQSFIHSRKVNCRVEKDGVSQGRTVLDKTGREVIVVDDVDRDLFFQYFTSVMLLAEDGLEAPQLYL
ncbi:ABC transporter substrate-binding protein [Bacillus hwajinpoensis]|uniref:ABC transporter substrate-binding protein n=1 Tax=Guptibacillus hwajinpoensis TaxID=208199 RepID=A0A845EWC5_9BACL|nr:nucleoside hydrolase [Pseudalkalibacillus hwajinpoensis]MYL62834.1 ABC transporter substrate-binding protein [Pseudalkalibacillus hwajinpoensis]